MADALENPASPAMNVHLRPNRSPSFAAGQEQAAERQRVRRDDPLATVGREAKSALRRRQRDLDNRHVERDHQLHHAQQR